METLSTDVALVGGGPIGLELAAGLKRARIDYRHFEAKQIGYTISWFAPGTRFFSSNERIAIAGAPLHTADQGKATREDYLNYLRCVVEQFDLNVNTYEPVVGIERGDGGFVLKTRPCGGERVCRARRLVLATGGTDHPRRLGIPGEDLPHVCAYFRDPHLYFRRKLLIVGGKNSAVEAALRCHHAGAHVTISYRGSELSPRSIKYWLLPEINDLIRSGRIIAHFNTTPVEITPTQVKLARVAGATEISGETAGGDRVLSVPRCHNPSVSPSLDPSLSLDVDFVLSLIGYQQDNTLLQMAGVALGGANRAPCFDERTMESNVPRVYVAGTAVAGTQDKYRVFIENCHVHTERIVAALTGAAVPRAAAPEPIAMPES